MNRIVDGVIVTDDLLRDVLGFLAERGPALGDLDSLASQISTTTGRPRKVVRAVLTFCVNENLIAGRTVDLGEEADRFLQPVTSKRRPREPGMVATPHLARDFHCTRCGVHWPCRSVVLGYDVAAARPTADDFPAEEDFHGQLVDLFQMGFVFDAGTRTPDPLTGQLLIRFRLHEGFHPSMVEEGELYRLGPDGRPVRVEPGRGELFPGEQR